MRAMTLCVSVYVSREAGGARESRTEEETTIRHEGRGEEEQEGGGGRDGTWGAREQHPAPPQSLRPTGSVSCRFQLTSGGCSGRTWFHPYLGDRDERAHTKGRTLPSSGQPSRAAHTHTHTYIYIHIRHTLVGGGGYASMQHSSTRGTRTQKTTDSDTDSETTETQKHIPRLGQTGRHKKMATKKHTNTHLDFHCVEDLAVVHTNHAADHLRDNNHVTQMSVDGIGFLSQGSPLLLRSPRSSNSSRQGRGQ